MALLRFREQLNNIQDLCDTIAEDTFDKDVARPTEEKNVQEEKDSHQTPNKIDYTCGICLNLNFEPVQLQPCGHSCFCQGCLHRLSLYGTGINMNCPLCRTAVPRSSVQRAIHLPTLHAIKNKYPKEYKAYQKQRTLLDTNQPTPKIYSIAFGNRYQKLENFETNRRGRQNKHQWTTFVELLDDKGKPLTSSTNRIIRNVHFNFRRYFSSINVRPVLKNQNKIEVSRCGWGSFDYNVTIQFAQELNLQDLELTAELSFDRNGIRCLYPVEMTLENLKKLKQSAPVKKRLTVAERRARGAEARRSIKGRSIREVFASGT